MSHRQRRYFYYLTGCDLPDCHFTYDIASGESTLFIPPVDAESVVWSGLPLSTAEALEQYDVHHAALTTDVNSTLAHLAKNSSKTVYAIPGQVSDHITFLEFEDKNLSILKEAIESSRVVKSDYEVALIQKASDISSAAHRADTLPSCHTTSSAKSPTCADSAGTSRPIHAAPSPPALPGFPYSALPYVTRYRLVIAPITDLK